jgi:transcriptional regulator with XRE-family HTH domain
VRRALQEVLAQRVRELREDQGLGREELHERLSEYGGEMPLTGVGKIERGERDVRAHELLALAAALGVSPAELAAPASGDEVLVGRIALTGDQVRAWMAGPLASLALDWIASHDVLSAEDVKVTESRNALPLLLAQTALELGESWKDGDVRGAQAWAVECLEVVTRILTDLAAGAEGPADWPPDREGSIIEGSRT